VLNHEMSKSTVCDTSVSGPIEGGSGYYAMIKTVQSLNDLPDTRLKLTDCAVPLLIMRGQCDGIKWGYVDEYSKYFKNIKVDIIPDAGHSIAREQPAKYLGHIRSFLQSS
jgi:pimeloyl-ACP methyl ester carboxylesterase